MTDRELAVGWLVFGKGETIADAETIVDLIGDFLVSLYADRQRAALAGFARLIDRIVREE